MTIDFYYTPASAPCRSVLLTAKALDIEMNLKEMDLMKGETRTPEFLKINPQHTVPTIVDDGFVLTESRAIITYLVSKYGKDDSLYPKDVKKRAIVDQRLYFDAGSLYQKYADYFYPIILTGASPDPALMEKLKDVYSILDVFLENSQYAAGNKLTVADLSMVATVSTAEATGFDISAYKNIVKWYENLKSTTPGYEEANGRYLKTFKQLIEEYKQKKSIK